MGQAARNHNQFHTSGALNNGILTNDPQLQSVFTSMTTMSDPQLQAALDQLSGELFGTLSSVGFQCTDNWFGTISNRLRPNGGAVQSFGLMSADSRARDVSDDVIEFVALGGSQNATNGTPIRNIATSSSPPRRHNTTVGSAGTVSAAMPPPTATPKASTTALAAHRSASIAM